MDVGAAIFDVFRTRCGVASECQTFDWTLCLFENSVMGHATVSIVIPSYNRAHLIAETLASVAAQTFTDYEVLVIDDGSKDNTEEVLRPWCERDSRIRYVRQANGGVSTARNHGLRLATGEFIAFLDSDDLWSPWKLALQVQLMRAMPHVGMLWTNMDTIDEQGQPLTKNYLRTMYSSYEGHGPEYPFQGSRALRDLPGLEATAIPAEVSPLTPIRTGQILREMVYGNLVHTSTVLLRKSVADRVGPFDEAMRRAGEDFDYHLRTCSLTDVAYLDVSSMLYRIGMNDQITSPDNNVYFARSYLISVKPFLKVPGLMTGAEQRNILAKSNRWLGEQLLESGSRLEALRCLLRSWFYEPCRLATLKQLLKGCLPFHALRRVRDAVRGVRAPLAMSHGLQTLKSSGGH
jgi:glycosyltransferase involved in cell wall biosynthesis